MINRCLFATVLAFSLLCVRETADAQDPARRPRGGRAREAAPPAGFSTAESSPQKVTPAVPASWADVLKWRCIGPANMGGRITSIAVSAKDPSMWWVASASGGLLKQSTTA